MTADEASTRLKQRMARLWRAVLDWDQAINTESYSRPRWRILNGASRSLNANRRRRLPVIERALPDRSQIREGDGVPASFIHAGQILSDSRNIDACLTNDS
jgi:hypothetical protein